MGGGAVTTRRPVRDDQHGTITGYVYGCRCGACVPAGRQYRRDRGGGRVSAEIADRVFAALEHEADMDGVATASGYRLGELAGVSHASATNALRLLADQGRVKIVGQVGRGGAFEVHLDGAA